MNFTNDQDLASLLSPVRCEVGAEKIAEWIIRRDKTFNQMLPEVAQYVRALDEQYLTQDGVRKPFAKLRKELAQNALIQEFERLRKGATALVFEAAIADIKGDQDFQSRFRQAASEQQEKLSVSDVSVPKYVSAPLFHWLPYVSEDPFMHEFIGAIWDLGSRNMFRPDGNDTSYTVGGGMAVAGGRYISKLDSSFKPKRILDMGCSAGGSTISMVEEYPDAEVWGIDVSSSMVTAAHARAVLLGADINFAQQNAESTPFASGSFDLIVSEIVFHELPNHARRAIIAESSRLLAPGGYMAHVEGATYMDPSDAFANYWRESAVRSNNEWYAPSAKVSLLESYIKEPGLQYEPKLLSKIGAPSAIFGNLAGSIQLIGAHKP